MASLSDKEKVALRDLLAKKPVVKSPFEIMAEAMIGRKYVKQWKLEELSKATKTQLKLRSYERGRKMFAAGGCFACHRFANAGGGAGDENGPVSHAVSCWQGGTGEYQPSRVHRRAYVA